VTIMILLNSPTTKKTFKLNCTFIKPRLNSWGFLFIVFQPFSFLLLLMKRIGVFTSGGDSPGMNACIRASVRTAISMDILPFGIKEGYNGMIGNQIFQMEASSVANIIQYGGTILKSSRSEAFFTKEGRAVAAENLKKHNIDGLVCIGGNGSYKGAELLEQEHGIPTIGCPGTIDNDLYGTDYTIGFDTAVNTAVEAIDKIRDTADSHNRVFFVEVMGRHSGHIALRAGIAGGAEGVFIPEKKHEIETIIEFFAKKKRKKAFSIFVVAEGDEEGRAFEIAKKFQSHFPETDTRVSVLGHIQRGGSPSVNDRLLATRLGAAAVMGLSEGHKNMAAGIVDNLVVLTPFEDAYTKTKGVPMDLWAINQLISR
jgi:6-phosphofructokinase 1